MAGGVVFWFLLAKLAVGCFSPSQFTNRLPRLGRIGSKTLAMHARCHSFQRPSIGTSSHIMLCTAVLTSLSQRVKGCASAGKGRLEVVSVGCEAPTFSHRDSFEKSHFAKEAAPLGGSNRAPKPRARCLNSHFLYIKVSARHGWRVRKLKEGCPVLRWPCQCWPTAQALGNKV